MARRLGPSRTLQNALQAPPARRHKRPQSPHQYPDTTPREIVADPAEDSAPPPPTHPRRGPPRPASTGFDDGIDTWHVLASRAAARRHGPPSPHHQHWPHTLERPEERRRHDPPQLPRQRPPQTTGNPHGYVLVHASQTLTTGRHKASRGPHIGHRRNPLNVPREAPRVTPRNHSSRPVNLSSEGAERPQCEARTRSS